MATSLTGAMAADRLNYEEAMGRARDFGLTLNRSIAEPAAKAGMRSAAAAAHAGEENYFVFPFDNQSGFVIVNSASTTDVPILGYSLNGDDTTVAPPAEALLKGYDARTTAKNQAMEIYGPFDAVEPLLKSQWNQDAPYNDACPETEGWTLDGSAPLKGRAAAGCVAIATAQVMRYHQYPADYAWNRIHDTHDTVTTRADNPEIARLIHDVGEAVYMSYGIIASSATTEDAKDALVNTFGYSTTASYCDRTFSYVAIDAMVYQELQQHRPVVYAAKSSTGGHAFVCDGMDTDGYLHINWGWGGLSDGYFHPTLLEPKSQGIGGSTGGYVSNIEVVTGIRPPKDGDKESMAYPFSEFSTTDGKSFSLTLRSSSGSVVYPSSLDYSWGVRFVNLSTRKTELELKADDSMTLPSYNLPDGDYRCFPIHRNNADAAWSNVWPTSYCNTHYIDIKVAGGKVTVIPVETPAEPALSIISHDLPAQADPYSTDAMRFTVRNSGAAYNPDWHLYAIFKNSKGEEQFRVMADEFVRSGIPAGGELEVVYRFSNLLNNMNLTIPHEALTVSIVDTDGAEIGQLGSVTILTKGFDSSEVGCQVLRSYLVRKFGATYFNDYNVNRLTELRTEGEDVTTLKGLERFPNLSLIDISASSALKEFEVSGFPALQILSISSCKSLTKAKIHDNPVLHGITLYNDNLSDLDVYSNGYEFEDKLITGVGITAGMNNLKKLDLRGQEKLCRVSVDDNPLKELLLPDNLDEFVQLDASDTELTTVELPKSLPALAKVAIDHSALTTLDLSGAPELYFVSVESNQLESLLLPQSNVLYYINVANNKLRELSTANLPALLSLDCSNNDIAGLDIAKSLKLIELNTSNNYRLSLCDFNNYDDLMRVNIYGANQLYCRLQNRDYQHAVYSTDVATALIAENALDLNPLIKQGMDISKIHPYYNCELKDHKLTLTDTSRRQLSYFYTSDANPTPETHFDCLITVTDATVEFKVDTDVIYLPEIGSTATLKLYDPLGVMSLTWKEEIIDYEAEDFGHWIEIDEWSKQFISEGRVCTLTRTGHGEMTITASAPGFRQEIKVLEQESAIEEITTAPDEATAPTGIYDLMGRRLPAATRPGLYIINGQKVAVK